MKFNPYRTVQEVQEIREAAKNRKRKLLGLPSIEEKKEEKIKVFAPQDYAKKYNKYFEDQRKLNLWIREIINNINYDYLVNTTIDASGWRTYSTNYISTTQPEPEPKFIQDENYKDLFE